MPQTRDIGRWYWYLQRYPAFSDWELPVRMPRLTEIANTREIEEPFRTGRGRAFRLAPTRWFFIIGRWKKHAFDHETVALERAVEGRMLTTRLAEIKQWPGAAPEEGFEDTPGVISWVDREATS